MWIPLLSGKLGGFGLPSVLSDFCIWKLFLSTLLVSRANFPGSCLPWPLRFQGQCISQPWSGEKVASLVSYSPWLR